MKTLLSEKEKFVCPIVQGNVQIGGYDANAKFFRMDLYNCPNDENKCMSLYYVPNGSKTMQLAYIPAFTFALKAQARNNQEEWDFIREMLPVTYRLLKNTNPAEPFVTAWKDVEDSNNSEMCPVLAIEIDEPYEIPTGVLDFDKQEDSNPETDRRLDAFMTAIEETQAEFLQFIEKVENQKQNNSEISPIGKKILRGIALAGIAFLVGDIVSGLDLDWLGGGDDGLFDGGDDGTMDDSYYDDTDSAGGSDISFTGSKDDAKMKKLKENLDYNIHQAYISNDKRRWTENIKDISNKMK